MKTNSRIAIEWLLLLSLVALIAFSSCKKNGQQDSSADGSGATRIEVEGSSTAGTEDGGGATDTESAAGDTPAEGETAADGEAAGEAGDAAAEGEEDGSGTAEGEGAAEGSGTEGETEGEGGEGSEGGEGEGNENGAEAEPPVSAGIDGSKIYVDNSCTMCHKADRSGTSLGPDIRDIAGQWDAAKLTTYLKDPSGTLQQFPHLVEMDKSGKYIAEMPPLREQDESRIKALVDWLLTPAK